MILYFFDGFRSDFSHTGFAGLRQSFEHFQVPRIKQELTHQRLTEIAIGLFNEQGRAEIPSISQHGEVVSSATLALDLSSEAKPHLRLTDQIKCCVGECDILFDHGGMAAPFRDAVAKDQSVVAHAAEEFEIRVHYIAPTSSGMSKKVGWR